MAVLVRNRGLYHGHVHRNHSPAQQVRDLRQGYWRVVRQARVHGFSGALPHEERRVPEIALKPLVGVRGDSDGAQMDHLDIEEGRGVTFHVFDESSYQVLRLSAACTDEQPIAPVNVREYLFFRSELLRISLSQLGQSATAVLPHLCHLARSVRMSTP